MPTINASREKYFFQFLGTMPPISWKHMPAASKPTPPAFPSTLTVPEQTEVKNWRSSRGIAKATLYAALTVNAKAKADAFIAWDLLRNAWEMSDKEAREKQWAWFQADAAISNYDAVPPSGSNTGTGGGAPATPQTKQEL